MWTVNVLLLDLRGAENNTQAAVSEISLAFLFFCTVEEYEMKKKTPSKEL